MIHTISLLEATDQEALQELAEYEKDKPLPAGSIGMLVRAVMRTSAGTYVKEFVHSDDGRTDPSIKSMLGLTSAVVVSLDVLDVELLWPPKLEYGPIDQNLPPDASCLDKDSSPMNLNTKSKVDHQVASDKPITTA